MNEKQTPIDAIDGYYALKNQYQSVFYDEFVKPILKSNSTNREKRVAFSHLPKPKCINCKREVGTIFDIKVNSIDYIRTFIAKCGDLNDPCPLDIRINYSIRESYRKLISEGLTNIEKIKLDIIKEKNNTLFFNSDTEVGTIFEKLTAELKAETENTGLSIETDILKNDNPAKANLLNKSIDEFGKGCIIPFKQMIKEYMEKNDELILNQALNFYVDEMLPKLEEIQKLKYEINIIEYYEGVYHLIQYPNTIESQEHWVENDDKVVKFVLGEKKDKKSQLSKPKKLDNKLTLIEATEALEDTASETNRESETVKSLFKPKSTSEPAKKKKRYEISEDEPIINEDNNEVTWELPIYKQVWRELPVKLKNVLITNKIWLKQFMYKCVNAKANNEKCRFTPPPNLVYPGFHKVLPNGEYDFGVPIYNEVFNELSEMQQKVLMSSKKIQGIDYIDPKLFDQFMNTAIAKKLDFY